MTKTDFCPGHCCVGRDHCGIFFNLINKKSKSKKQINNDNNTYQANSIFSITSRIGLTAADICLPYTREILSPI